MKNLFIISVLFSYLSSYGQVHNFDSEGVIYSQGDSNVTIGSTNSFFGGDRALEIHGSSPLLGLIGNSPNQNNIILSANETFGNSLAFSNTTFFSFTMANVGNIMRFQTNGKVSIGTDNSDNDDYQLYVANGIKTEKVKVEIANENGWADYVFNDDYRLLSLADLENFINTYNHLPEVPSSEEAIKNGIELKEMSVLLLKKVEELTLYLLEQNNKIEKLSQEINSLKN